MKNRKKVQLVVNFLLVCLSLFVVYCIFHRDKLADNNLPDIYKIDKLSSYQEANNYEYGLGGKSLNLIQGLSLYLDAAQTEIALREDVQRVFNKIIDEGTKEEITQAVALIKNTPSAHLSEDAYTRVVDEELKQARERYRVDPLQYHFDHSTSYDQRLASVVTCGPNVADLQRAVAKAYFLARALKGPEALRLGVFLADSLIQAKCPGWLTQLSHNPFLAFSIYKELEDREGMRYSAQLCAWHCLPNSNQRLLTVSDLSHMKEWFKRAGWSEDRISARLKEIVESRAEEYRFAGNTKELAELYSFVGLNSKARLVREL